MNAKGIVFVLIVLLVVIFVLIIGMSGTSSNENIQNITTPYDTICKLNIGNGIDPDQTTVNDDGQKIVFEDGYKQGIFISTDKDLSELTSSIEATGTKCSKDGVVWYHLSDKQLANSYSVFGGTHLKLEDVNDRDVGFISNPNGGETIILIASPETIVNCFNSIEWG